MAIIPAIMTGMTDFMINSGLSTADDDIPTPARAVPKAAPNAIFYWIIFNLLIKIHKKEKF